MDREMREEIIELKRKKRAVILAHNYQIGEIQEVADYVGDSLELSQIAIKLDCKLIVFCGVHFMAETAAILNPDKTVLLPEIDAGCPMAEMVSKEKLVELQSKYPEAATVSYVNTTAEIKALSYICCTSANAPEIVRAIPFNRIIFVPDKNLASWVKRNVPEKDIIPWNGLCPTHHMIKREDVLRAKEAHPNALVVVHPECRPEVIDLADHVASTSGMVKFCVNSVAEEFLIGTEVGLLYRLKKEAPHKKFYPVKDTTVCPNMKMTTLQSLYIALKEEKPVVSVEEKIRVRAREALERMIALSK